MSGDVFVRVGQQIGFLIPDGDPDACWPWQGYRDKAGYGRAYSHHLKRGTPAHRLAWSWLNGQPPPRSSGYEVDHLCNNRSCVNPSHLALVTLAVNRQRHDGSRPGPIQHGTVGGYTHRGCRCRKCRKVWAKYQAERRYQQRAMAALLLEAGHISPVLLARSGVG